MADSIKDNIREDDAQKIRELVEQMKLYNNPQELEDMKKLMKKNVSFTMRGYLLAYLYITRGGNTQRPQRQERRPQQTPAVENATSFYINIGKASKSNPRELVDFICEKTGLNSEDILSVAFKQNYSFVYVSNDKKEGIIEAVNGQTFKGRKVKMNYSKEKDEQN
ncbi:MAG: DbpA RNA binding domain-containing protein [Spirochaetales bacterium]|nr:DbpA RNA binding domain-containing protein [Spirochaetales bacterium]